MLVTPAGALVMAMSQTPATTFSAGSQGFLYSDQGYHLIYNNGQMYIDGRLIPTVAALTQADVVAWGAKVNRLAVVEAELARLQMDRSRAEAAIILARQDLGKRYGITIHAVSSSGSAIEVAPEVSGDGLYVVGNRVKP